MELSTAIIDFFLHLNVKPAEECRENIRPNHAGHSAR